MKAIETHYAGCRFRSRLEARWAVCFDHLAVDWQYEPQGFVVDGHPYLPDFLLTDSGIWVEVKGAEDQLDHSLMAAAAESLPGGKLLILGPIPKTPVNGDWAWLCLETVDGSDEIFPFWLAFELGGQFVHASETSCAPPGEDDDLWLEPALNMVHADPRVVAAYRAARSARFEHGETPGAT